MKKLLICLIGTILVVSLAIWFLLSQDDQIVSLKKKIIPDNTPQVAIILDDVGKDPHVVNKLLALPYPITFSVIPRSTYACEISEDIWASGKEVMLHMPMEADKSELIVSYNVKLTLKMSARQIENELENAIEEVKFVSGVNNHMGSAFTRDKESMTSVFQFLAKNKLYFIDSKTNSKNPTKRLASEFNVKFAARDIFLDIDPEPEAIREQFYKLIEVAKQKGKAVAIGHIQRPTTIIVLQEMLPKIEEAGVKLVFASELVK